MSATFKALAKTKAHCALATCTIPAGKIYEGEGLRVLACTEGHANAAIAHIAKAPRITDREQRNAAIRLFNARPAPQPKEEENDYDIDF